MSVDLPTTAREKTDTSCSPTPQLQRYRLLGNSGLRVSPLCLGTMTFGTDWGWGVDEPLARRLLDHYIDAGGNFVDTADRYTNGRSEELLGKFIKERGDRDRLVLASKFSFNTRPGDPNAGGNSRKNIRQAVQGSLRRLQTDYLDVYWLHAWDCLTPVDEVISSLDDLVRAGQVRYIGFSDVPAWYLARAQTIAQLRGYEPLCSVQLEYSLAERNIEREHIPAASALGIGVCGWSPLASGLLTGKYARNGLLPEGDGRLAVTKNSGNPAFTKLFTERNWQIVEAVARVGIELDCPPAQVALSWVTRRPSITSTLIGATTLEQLIGLIAALDIEIPDAHFQRLNQVSQPETVFPYQFFEPTMQKMLTGGCSVTR